MNKTDNNLSPFERQLMQSTARLRDEQNYQLPLKKSPRRHRSPIAWIASTAAAVVGWLVGIAFPLGEQQPKTELAMTTKTDTVIEYRDRIVRDTIVKKVEIPIKIETAHSKEKQSQNKIITVGSNVECDGIDYAMLIGM